MSERYTQQQRKEIATEYERLEAKARAWVQNFEGLLDVLRRGQNFTFPAFVAEAVAKELKVARQMVDDFSYQKQSQCYSMMSYVGASKVVQEYENKLHAKEDEWNKPSSEFEVEEFKGKIRNSKYAFLR